MHRHSPTTLSSDHLQGTSSLQSTSSTLRNDRSQQIRLWSRTSSPKCTELSYANTHARQRAAYGQRDGGTFAQSTSSHKEEGNGTQKYFVAKNQLTGPYMPFSFSRRRHIEKARDEKRSRYSELYPAILANKGVLLAYMKRLAIICARSTSWLAG